MKISGFSMVKNADKLYYPIKAAIESILPIVDEFVVALGDCDEDDNTELEIRKINSDKIKIIHTKWDINKYPDGTENAHQTDIAKEACSGDWLFYLQADEVIHERYLSVIKERCRSLLKDMDVEALLFKYIHFWADYNHYHVSHGWYPREIRIIRNDPDIHSWESAQSFRRIPNFDHINYRQQENTYKLKAALVNAYVYHYGWVRPPNFMQKKRRALDTIHKGEAKVNELYSTQKEEFDYGPLSLTNRFEGTHPKVMKQWIEKFYWGDQLYEKGPIPKNRPRYKHEKLKYRMISFFEQNIFGGKHIGGFKNYNLLNK